MDKTVACERTWVRYQLHPDILISQMYVGEKKSGTSSEKLHFLAVPCKKTNFSHVIYRKTKYTFRTKFIKYRNRLLSGCQIIKLR